MKKCSKCKASKSIDDFYKNPQVGTKDGLHSWCKECCRELNRKTYRKRKKENPEKLKEYANKWRANNIERARALQKKSYEKRRYETLCHYGGTPPKCACCGETEIKFLLREFKRLSMRSKFLTPLIGTINDVAKDLIGFEILVLEDLEKEPDFEETLMLEEEEFSYDDMDDPFGGEEQFAF